MAKKMNIANLKKQSSKEFDYIKIIVDNYEILIEPKFKESKIRLLLNEFDEKSEYAEKEGLIFNPHDYLFVLILKYFTDIKMTDKYDTQIQMLSLLIDLGYFEKIMSYFDQSEIDKIISNQKRVVMNLKNTIEQMKEFDFNA